MKETPSSLPELDAILERFLKDTYVENDPIGEVRKFETPPDREVAAFVAAGYAFGNITSILNHLREIWRRTGDEIARFTELYSFKDDTAPFTDLKYRWIEPAATCALFHVLGEMLRRDGSIEAFFTRGKQHDLAESLHSFVTRALALAPAGLSKSATRSLKYMFTSTRSGSACKRLNLFLRWVVRKDYPDLGLWSCISPADLLIPLDVHVARVSARLGLTARKTMDWEMAAEITARLRRLDPEDPVKYDFAIHKLGATASESA